MRTVFVTHDTARWSGVTKFVTASEGVLPANERQEHHDLGDAWAAWVRVKLPRIVGSEELLGAHTEVVLGGALEDLA